jgi:hypothetical protein
VASFMQAGKRAPEARVAMALAGSSAPEELHRHARPPDPSNDCPQSGVRGPRHRPGGGTMHTAACRTRLSICSTRFFSALRRLFSSGPQIWQNLQLSPAVQPSLDR